LPLLQVAGPLLLGTPAAMVGPALCVIAQLLFAALWVWGAAYLASSGMVELTHAEGYARPTFDSGVKLLLIVWALGGIWTFAFIRHLGLLAAAGPLARGYWLSAELRAQLPAPPLYVRLLGPWVRAGSAAVGATLHCSGASALVAVLQSFGVHRLDALDEAGYVSVALFGTGYVEGSRWATSITSRFVPRLLMMQARCGLDLSFCKLACAMGATAVAAAQEHHAPAGPRRGRGAHRAPAAATFPSLRHGLAPPAPPIGFASLTVAPAATPCATSPPAGRPMCSPLRLTGFQS
jgi:hypothetical protein